MKIRVIRFSSLGDCILLCPFLTHLKCNGADEVSVVTKRGYAELFAATRGVDGILALDERAGRAGVRQIIAAHRHDEHVLIDAHNTTRSRLIARGLGGSDVRLKKYYGERLALIWLKRATDLPSMRERYSALGEALGFPPLHGPLDTLDIPQSALGAAQELLGGHAGGAVAMAPGSRWATKRWGRDKFVELARRLQREHACRIVLLGDAGDRESNADIARAAGTDILDLSDRTPLMVAAAVLRSCRAFIGNDSGLMHLAEAVDTPVVSVFGPTVQAFGYYPALPDSKVVERDISCRPCTRNGSHRCPKWNHECLARIPVSSVETAFVDLINSRGPSRYVVN